MQLSAAELADVVIDVFDRQLPFNNFLGFKVKKLSAEQVELHLPWKDELMGNPLQRILHGGVTASILDTVGGLVSILYATKDLPPMTLDEFQQRLAKTGTIDMRVDYLRPGRGSAFVASAEVIRKGNRVAVCRMELHNQDNEHIAFGTGTYMIG